MSSAYLGHAQPLTERAKLTIAAHGTYMPSWIASKLFLGIYLIRETGSIKGPAIFFLASFISLCGMFFLVAPSCKKHGLLIKFRAGLVLCVIFFLYLAIARSSIVNQLIFAGILFGAANGCYWFPYHLYKMTMSKPSARLTYLAYENNMAQVLHLFLPPFFGWLIWTKESYIGLFILLAVFVLGGFFISNKLERRGNRFDTEYSLSGLFSLMKTQP